MYDQQPQGGMQTFGFDVNSVEPARSFEPLPPAWYNVMVAAAEMKPLESGKGTALTIQYKVFGGPFNERVLFENLNVVHESEKAQEISRRSVRSIQDSLGKPINGPIDMLNGYLCVKAGLSSPDKNASEAEKAAFEARNQIRGYKAFDQQLHMLNQQSAAQAPQQYAVQVAPMGNAAPNFAQQSVPQSVPMQQAPQQQAYAPQQPQPQQQYAQQPAPQQYAPQQPQPQQQYAPQPDNGQGQQPAQQYTQQAPQQNAPGAMAPAGQPSQPQAAPPAGYQTAPPQTFAPGQNAQPPMGNVPPPQQQVPQQNAQPPQPNPAFAQPQQQQPQPPQGQPPSGNAPPPGPSW